ncbi:MAG TPA: phosphate acyltransferase PlsX [Alphaproteobacteria bacterium]|nr:phosphate acyltransferase PlsX [Alphaproteobacteria bacterium]
MSDFTQTVTALHAITIAVDAMGGDFGPEIVIPGLNIIHEENKDIRFILIGDESRIYPYLNKYSNLKDVCRVVHTDRMVRNNEKPSAALRASKGTSMRMAIEAVAEGHAHAAVSAGNTGALMAMAKVVLRMLPGIHRPALASVFPSMHGSTVMLDLGANVLVDAETLTQFAVLGAVFARAHKGIQVPTVGLLNVGSEEMKGPDHVRAAHNILSKVDFPGQYKGFVEGDDITKGTVDVVVCDGYAGNIALKTGEGVGRMTGHYFKEAISSDPLAILGGALAFFAMKRFKHKVDPRLYNGGVFVGLNGVCVKSHGGTDALGFSSAVRLATQLARQGYVKKVADEINRLMSQDSFLSQGTYEG